MPRIPESLNIGDRSNLTPERLLELMEDMYRELAVSINQKPDILQRSLNGVPQDGNAADSFASIGDININTSTDKVEIVTNHDSASTVVWTTLYP